MTSPEVLAPADSSDVVIVTLADKTIYLVGTAHISQQSVDLVARVIEREHPDTVCIELDAKRYEALATRQRWENLDLKEIIKQKQLTTLLVNLILSTYQKKLGGKLGVMPGSELLAAAQTAKQHGIAIELCDRDVRITLRRAWRATPFWKKSYLLASLLTSLFDDTALTEEKLAELRHQDVLSELLGEIGAVLPEAKVALIDERDIYMAEKIKAAAGERIVAVVGAGHVAGIQRRLLEDNRAGVAELTTTPPSSAAWKVAGWSVPVAILLSILLIAYQKGLGAAGDSIIYWIVVTGTPTAIGAILAWAHPLTIFSAFAAAPFTTLSPVIGAGYVTALVQVMYRPPLVREFECVGRDMGTMGGWWRNKLLRVFLVFFLTGVGGMIGTWVGSVKIFSTITI